MSRSAIRARTTAVLIAVAITGVLTACDPPPPPDGRDVRLTVADPPGTLVVGESVTFTAEVGNVGTAPAPDARLGLAAPVGLAIAVTIDGSGAACTEGVVAALDLVGVECDLGDLATGQTRDVQVEVVGEAAGVAGGIVLVARSPGGSEPADGGAPHRVDLPVEVVAADVVDLHVTADPIEGPSPAGIPFPSRTTVVNRGSVPATDVTVTQTFPAGHTLSVPTLVRGDGATGTCGITGTVATCTTDGLTVEPLTTADDAWEMVVQSTPTSGSSAGIVHAATSPHPEPDPDPSPNTATVDGWFDLGHLELVLPDTIAAGSTFEAQIVWHGPGIGQYVQAWIPPTLRLDSLDLPLLATEPCQGTGQVACASIAAFLVDGTSLTATFTALAPGGPDEMSFGISSEAGSASGEETVVVVDPAITSDVHPHVVAPPYALVGEPVTVAGEVRTAGPVAHEDVIVTMVAPAGSAVHGVTWGDLRLPCAVSGRVATCSVGDVPGHDRVPIEVTLTAYADGPATLTAEVASATPQDDPDPWPDIVEASFPVRGPFVDLGVSATAETTTPLEGSAFDIVVRATNHGSEPTTGVVLTVTIPDGWNLSSYGIGPGAAGTCNSSGTERTCTFPSVAGGSEGRMSLRVWAGPPGPTTFHATVSGDDPDPVPDEQPNQVQLVIDPVAAHADLGVGLAVPVDPVVVGEEASVIARVTNHGPSPVGSSTVEIVIPEGWVLVSASSAGGSCTVAGSVATCVTGSIFAGGSRIASARVGPDGVRTGDVVHATVTSSPLPDPDPSSDTAQAELSSVAPFVDLGIDPPAAYWDTFPGLGGSFAGRRIDVTNYGTVEATDVVLEGTFSAGISISNVAELVVGQGFTCTWTTSTFTCQRPRITAGSTAEIQLSALVAAVPGPITLTLVVGSSSTADPGPPDGAPNERTIEMVADP